MAHPLRGIGRRSAGIGRVALALPPALVTACVLAAAGVCAAPGALAMAGASDAARSSDAAGTADAASAAAPEGTSAAASAAAGQRPRGIVPKSRPGRSIPPDSVQFIYYGGPIIPAIKIYQVLWGTGTYLPGVANGGATTATKMGDFYRAITGSPYLDWMCEYDAGGLSIGRGQFAQTITITPTAPNGGALLDDAHIQAEIAAQVAAGVLPPPDADTVFMIHFPKGVTIDDPAVGQSCVDFCAYHSTGLIGGQYVYYGVLPDFSPGTGCDLGCGVAPALFDDLCSTASHEIAEAITDPAVGQGTDIAYPLAWYDIVNGEIGDVCELSESSLLGSDGVTYDVQNVWSSQLGHCIATKPNDPPVAACRDVTVTVSGCSAPVSIDNGSHDPDCWDTVALAQSPAGPYAVGTTSVTLTATDNAGAFSSCTGQVTVVSNGCDDGIACTTGDTCQGAVCAGTPGPPPAEVGASLAVTLSGNLATITWTPAAGATSSDVLRGRVSALPVGPGGGDESCLADETTGRSMIDAAVPPVGDGYWYLVRGRSFCGVGPWGFEIQTGQPPSPEITSTCP